MNRLLSITAAATLLAACADRGIQDVSARRMDEPFSAADVEGRPGISVLTWNVYYGTDPAPLLTAPLEQVPFLAAQVWATVQRTNFPERAGALAAAIAAHRPHLVGVQEAAIYRIQSPGDAIVGGAAPATTVVYDFLPLLQDSLAARGLRYIVAAVDSTTDIELPVFTGIDPASGMPTFDDVRLTDRDAVLARSDVGIENPQHAKFAAFIPVSIGPVQTGVFEGWSSVEATVGGQRYRFVSTHLEFQGAEPVQVAQAQELLALLQHEALPTILVGDFNSDAYGQVPSKATPSYGMITGAGFDDTWLRSQQTQPGLTCCQSVELTNSFSTFDTRVDFIFTRNLPAQAVVVGRQLMGETSGSRTRSGLWPSDHAGVLATFITPPVFANAVAALP